MKKINYILGLLIVVVVASSCFNKEEARPVEFEDLEKFTIYDYMADDDTTNRFSDFLLILKAGKLDKTLQAYNPEGTDYTLFLPDNDAIKRFIEEDSQISSLNDIINNPEYAALFCRYHVVSIGVESGDFPFGAFSKPALSGENDFLTVSFIVEADTSYYKINNQAAVIYRDIDASNGFIHLIDRALSPVNFTSYGWLGLTSGFSIFKEAADLTGFGKDGILDLNTKTSDTILPSTLLVESDEIFNDFGIYSIDDLIAKVSPNDQDYKSNRNPLYNFVGYHIIRDGNTYFINDLEGTDATKNTNYNTLSEVPLRIDGTGIEIKINPGKQVFDTIISPGGDSTFVDYIGLLYDDSNITSLSGAIHQINKLMTQQRPSRAIQTFEFGEEKIFNEQFRITPGTHLIDEEFNIRTVSWSGPDLYFVELGSQQSSAWGNDYLEINGDFEISYTIPKIIQGKYEMYIRAERFNSQNAMVEVYVDNNRLGGFISMTSGGSATSPFNSVLVGTVFFSSYSSHTITVKSLIPGRFLWDYVQFQPI